MFFSLSHSLARPSSFKNINILTTLIIINILSLPLFHPVFLFVLLFSFFLIFILSLSLLSVYIFVTQVDRVIGTPKNLNRNWQALEFFHLARRRHILTPSPSCNNSNKTSAPHFLFYSIGSIKICKCKHNWWVEMWMKTTRWMVRLEWTSIPRNVFPPLLPIQTKTHTHTQTHFSLINL